MAERQDEIRYAPPTQAEREEMFAPPIPKSELQRWLKERKEAS